MPTIRATLTEKLAKAKADVAELEALLGNAEDGAQAWLDREMTSAKDVLAQAAKHLGL
jgi:hypothetical protein